MKVIESLQVPNENMPYKIDTILVVFLLSGFVQVSAQDLALEENGTVTDAFRSTILINAQTTTMSVPHSFDFTIRHRFGTFGFDRNGIRNFFGLDLVANIRFGFVVPLTVSTYIGAGRTKNGKMYDVEIKHLLFTQTQDNTIPVTAALYVNASINTDDFLPVPKYAYFADGSTDFNYKFNHRLTYNSQLIVSRKFGEKFSFQLNPSFVYKNLVPAGIENYTLVVPLGGAYKTGISSSVLIEYAYRFNNKPSGKLYPLSLAMEFGTVGHVFQLVVSSTQELLEQQQCSGEVSAYTNGKLLLGFNLKRTFWKKEKKK
jgi:hypothetical protein